MQIVERETGRALLPVMTDIVDGHIAPLDQCSVQAGPAVNSDMRQRLESVADQRSITARCSG